MKISLAFALVMGLAVAHADPAVVQYPFLAPKCNDFIRTPLNQNPALFSEDCKTAFVLPSVTGQTEIDYLKNYTNEKLCQGFYNIQDAAASLNAEIARLSQQLATIAIDDPKRGKIFQEIATINDSIGKIYVNFEKVIGADAEVHFSIQDDQSRKDVYLLENAQVFRQGLNIMSPDIQESYISFNANNGSLVHDGVLDFKIAGLQPVNGNTDPAMKVYRGGFNSTAALSLSMWGACPGRGLPPPSADNFGLSVSPVVTYTVPVLSWGGYTASLDNKQAITNIMSVFQTKAQFEVADHESYDSVGSAGNAFVFTPNAGPGGYTQEQQKNFFSDLRQEVLQRLTNRLLDQLTVAGFVQMATSPAALQAPPPGTVDQTVDGGTSCGGGFLGIGRTCIHHVYTIKIPVNSTASQLMSKALNLNFTNTESVQVREPVTRVYTTVYQLKKTPAAPVAN